MADVIKQNPSVDGTPRSFIDGSVRSVVMFGNRYIGHGEYRPGWRWSTHAGAQTGRPSEAHLGYVGSGRLTVHGADGTEVSVGPGDAFESKPGNDAWVVGDEVCVALDFGVVP